MAANSINKFSTVWCTIKRMVVKLMITNNKIPRTVVAERLMNYMDRTSENAEYSKKLKSCPYCTGDACLIGDDVVGYQVYCLGCGAKGPANEARFGWECAVDNWNDVASAVEQFNAAASKDIRKNCNCETNTYENTKYKNNNPPGHKFPIAPVIDENLLRYIRQEAITPFTSIKSIEELVNPKGDQKYHFGHRIFIHTTDFHTSGTYITHHEGYHYVAMGSIILRVPDRCLSNSERYWSFLNY